MSTTSEELRSQIENMVFRGEANNIPEQLLTEYDHVEEDNSRAMAIFTLVEQASLPVVDRDPNFVWLPEPKTVMEN